MVYSSEKHHRRSIRLRNHDYSSPGYYFITARIIEFEHLFGEVRNSKMEQNSFGQIVEACWHDLPEHYPHVRLDAWIVMPDHVHGIIILTSSTTLSNPHGLPEIVRTLKSFSARRINCIRDTIGTAIWQRNYYDRVIRSERELFNTRTYIANNPARWEE